VRGIGYSRYGIPGSERFFITRKIQEAARIFSKKKKKEITGTQPEKKGEEI